MQILAKGFGSFFWGGRLGKRVELGNKCLLSRGSRRDSELLPSPISTSIDWPEFSLRALEWLTWFKLHTIIYHPINYFLPLPFFQHSN